MLNATYENHKGRWIVENNADAETIKQLHPYDPVFIYDRKTGKYTRYTIKYKHKKPHMHHGKLIYETETKEI